MIDRNVVLRWVNYWHTLGFNLVPISLKAKVPIKGFKWSEWQDKPQTLEYVTNLVNQGSFDGGLAIITGKIWRGKYQGKYITGIDLDNSRAVEIIAPLFDCKDLQDLAQKTIVVLHKDKPHKGHIMVVSDIPIQKKDADSDLLDQQPKIEIKSTTTQLIHCPPSIHADGHPYEVIGNFEPLVLGIDETNTLVQQIDNLCRQNGIGYLERIGQKREVSWEPVKEGSRDNQAFNNALQLVRKGMSPDMVLSALLAWDEKNDPPLGETILKQKVESALKYKFPENLQEPEEDTGGKKPKIPKKTGWAAADSDMFVTHFLANLPKFVTLIDNDVIYQYNPENGCFETNCVEARIMEDLERMDPKISDKKVGEILNKLRRRTHVTRVQFDSEPEWLHCRNGWLNLYTREFQPHSPDRLSFGTINAIYDVKAQSPTFAKYLTSTYEPEYIKTVIKMLGYCLLRSTKYQKAFMLVGEGSNGKSVLLDIIKALFGSEKCTAETLQRLAKEKFSVARLYGKLVNLCADIPSEKITDTGIFKMLVSGDLMTVEHKHRDPFEMVNGSKLIFSANKIPEAKDMDYAYLRRWIVIPFFRIFEGDKADKDLLKKIERELSGVLNLALTGLRMLEADGGFNENMDKVKQLYTMGASRVSDFVNKCIMTNPTQGKDEAPLTEEISAAFREFCKEAGSKTVDEGKLSIELKKLGAENSKRTKRGDRRHCWRYIMLNDEGQRLLKQAYSSNTPDIWNTEEVRQATEDDNLKVIKKIMSEIGEGTLPIIVDMFVEKTNVSVGKAKEIVSEFITGERPMLTEGNGRDTYRWHK